ncbi:RAP protein, putative [Plasmodium ovale]|uniref:RAP protein, putative n=1 Tax=Plasmodium ovale TaxID=36330 RepID=A0A1D3KYW8_PLAOA|nr:RAP protein, putative [Plasmodium ovale]
MVFFFHVPLAVAYSIYIVGSVFFFADNVQSNVLENCKRSYRVNSYSFVNKAHHKGNVNNWIHQNEKKQNIFKKKNIFYYHHQGGNKGNYNNKNSKFIEIFNKKHFFVKPTYAQLDDNEEYINRGKTGKLLERDSEQREKSPVVRTGESCANGGSRDGKHVTEEDDDQYDLVNEYILLRRNGKSISDMMKEGIWVFPKENIKMIRERTNKKINWNYILKKNNPLLTDNVDKIYDGIYKKENIDDVFFVFDTYPYNYLNVTMSVFCLYKFASTYLNEKREKIKNKNTRNMYFFKDEIKRNKSVYDNENNVDTSSYDHLFTLDSTSEEVDNTDLLKIKEERKRLHYITKNRNFLRIIGSICKHLKIIYKIFSTNQKLTTYEKSKHMYNFIPYINIKDIITILRSFCILKYDHTNIYKYIYFYLVFFMDKFDIVYLCEAVYLCIIKKIYIKPLFQKFSKRLLKYIQQGDKQSLDKNTINSTTSGISNIDSVSTFGSDNTVENTSKENPNDNPSPGNIKLESSITSLYEEINIVDIYNSMEKILKGEKKESINYRPSPFHTRQFLYTIYHQANYSNLNCALDNIVKEKDSKNYEIKNFTHEDKRKDKINFLENNPMNNDIENIKKCYEKKNVHIDLYVYCLYIMSKFPYSDVTILHLLTSKIMNRINHLTIEELILTFSSLSELEYDSFKLQNCLYILIFRKLSSLDYRNNGMILRLIRSLFLANDLVDVADGGGNHDRGSERIGENGCGSGADNPRVRGIKTVMAHFLSKMVLKNARNYSPVELVDIIRYMSAMSFLDKELFNFVYELPFFKNLNENTLNFYKNTVYFNQSYYAYTRDNTINTPIEIMLCKLYQSYLCYNMYIDSNKSLLENNLTDKEKLVLNSILSRNNEKKSFQFSENILKLFRNTYINNMKISSYSSSSLHYEIADIIQKDFKIPCHVEFKTSNGIFIDIAILHEDFKKLNKKFPHFKNVAIEVNGPFHYKTKSLNGQHLPFLTTKTILKWRLLEHDEWQVISLPFWEIKPWFTKARKENYLLKMLPDNLKSFFNEAKNF